MCHLSAKVLLQNMRTRGIEEVAVEGAVSRKIFFTQRLKYTQLNSLPLLLLLLQPFNGLFSRTSRVSRYQKGKTNLDFTAARDSEWQWHLAPDR